MAKLKVSELTRTENVNSTDLVYVVQGPNSRAVTVANLFQGSGLVGPPGPPGEQGPQGEQGLTGPVGTIGLTYTVSANANTSYNFVGPGFPVVPNDNLPLYVYRGFTYVFVNTSIDHPFTIREEANGNAYVLGVTIDQEDEDFEIITFVVPMNAPDTLYYQCNVHTQMGNVIYIR